MRPILQEAVDALPDWWERIDSDPAWRKYGEYGLAAGYGLIALVALIQLVRFFRFTDTACVTSIVVVPVRDSSLPVATCGVRFNGMHWRWVLQVRASKRGGARGLLDCSLCITAAQEHTMSIVRRPAGSLTTDSAHQLACRPPAPDIGVPVHTRH